MKRLRDRVEENYHRLPQGVAAYIEKLEELLHEGTNFNVFHDEGLRAKWVERVSETIREADNA